MSIDCVERDIWDLSDARPGRPSDRTPKATASVITESASSKTLDQNDKSERLSTLFESACRASKVRVSECCGRGPGRHLPSHNPALTGRLEAAGIPPGEWTTSCSLVAL
jgi:hypothetical protein